MEDGERQKKVSVFSSPTYFCLPVHCVSGSEHEPVEERRQKQLSGGFHFNVCLFNPPCQTVVVVSSPSGCGANDSRIRARSN